MEFKIIAPGGDNLEIIHAMPHTFKGHVLPLTTATHVKADFGNMVFQNYCGEGFSIWYSNYDIVHETLLVGRADLPVLELHIQLANAFQNDWDGIGEKFIKRHHYNLTYTPFVMNKVKFMKGRHYFTFDIHFKSEYLQKLAPHFPVLDRFLNLVEKGKPADISKLDRFLSPAMVKIAFEVLNCPYKNGVADFFIEAKVIELLLMVLDDCSDEQPLGAVRLDSTDIDKFHAIKSLIEENINHPKTLSQISKEFLMNQDKLKKGFKYLFGVPVYKYMNTVRMNKAKQLVAETNLMFEEIAEQTGFADRASFDKTFKKHFKCTPAYFRKNS